MAGLVSGPIPGRLVFDTGPLVHMAKSELLGLIIDAINDGHIGRSMGSKIADEFAGSGARVPFEPGGFISWAESAGMFYGPAV